MNYNAVVDMHLPGGFTKLSGEVSGGHYFDVRTDSIPAHLRTIASKVLLKIRREAVVVEDRQAE